MLRGCGLLLLLFWLWGAVVLRALVGARINYFYLLDLDEATAIGWVGVLKASAALTCAYALAALLWVFNLDATAGLLAVPPQWAFLAFLVFMVGILLWPQRSVMYGDTRRWLLRHLGRIAATPFISVRFVDSLIADILTSMVGAASMHALERKSTREMTRRTVVGHGAGTGRAKSNEGVATEVVAAGRAANSDGEGNGWWVMETAHQFNACAVQQTVASIQSIGHRYSLHFSQAHLQSHRRINDHVRCDRLISWAQAGILSHNLCFPPVHPSLSSLPPRPAFAALRSSLSTT